METERGTVQTEAIFTQAHTHRLLLRKVWDKTRPTASIIMINPHTASTFYTDATTMYTLNHLYQLGFGTANLLNLYTRICERLALRFNSDEDLLDPQNDEMILKCAAESDTIIIAWGSAGHNSQRVRDRQAELLDLLKTYPLKSITDGGDTAYHPLSPAVRDRWILKDYVGVEHDAYNNGTGN
ncbi:MAG: DUF1643 domain-containing protein [Oscillospiraceae bacterium]|nr:DUF1643 domain-containing protein [Oscillospiraceae bacterium]